MSDNQLTFKSEPVSKKAAVPHHVGEVGASSLFEKAVHEPIMVEVEGVYIDALTGEETESPKWYKTSPDDNETVIESGRNEPKRVQATYPGTDIPAFSRGGGDFYADLEDEDGTVIKRVPIPVKALPLKHQAALIGVSEFVRSVAAKDWSEEYGVTVLERPE